MSSSYLNVSRRHGGSHIQRMPPRRPGQRLYNNKISSMYTYIYNIHSINDNNSNSTNMSNGNSNSNSNSNGNSKSTVTSRGIKARVSERGSQSPEPWLVLSST